MRLRLAVISVLILALLSGVLAGCGEQPKPAASPAAPKPEPVDPFANIKRIQKAGVLKVGTSAGYFPFEMTDTKGKVIGFDAELAERIAKELGVKLEIKDMDFNGLIPALQAGTVDIVLAGVTITPKRALSVNFTRPYFQTGQAVLVAKKHQGKIKSYEDLNKAGIVVSVSMGTTGDIAATKLLPKATIKRFDNSNNAALEVVSGRADAMVFDQPDIAVHAKKNAATTFGLLDPFTVENFGIAVIPGQPDLVQWLNTFLDSFVGTLEYQNMYKYWFVDMPWWNDVKH